MRCQVFAAPDLDEVDTRLCSEEDGGETVVFHSRVSKTEGGVRVCTVCNLREDEVDEADTIVRQLINGQWETLGPNR